MSESIPAEAVLPSRPAPAGIPPLVRVAAVAALLSSAGLLAACSMSFPIASLKDDDTPTGSIGPRDASLMAGLDQEDSRRAGAALALALDPQGEGTRVNWDNPRSGAKGTFVALAPPFTRDDRICRRFGADLTAPGASGRRMTGDACRNSDGSWTLGRLDANAAG